MILEIKHPDSIALNVNEIIEFKCFLQAMADRRAVGGLRYGRIKKKQKYMARLQRELTAYKRTGNMEQLFNIAVYAFLESYAPQNKKFHVDTTAPSVTREKFGGAIA